MAHVKPFLPDASSVPNPSVQSTFFTCKSKARLWSASPCPNPAQAHAKTHTKTHAQTHNLAQTQTNAQTHARACCSSPPNAQQRAGEAAAVMHFVPVPIEQTLVGGCNMSISWRLSSRGEGDKDEKVKAAIAKCNETMTKLKDPEANLRSSKRGPQPLQSATGSCPTALLLQKLHSQLARSPLDVISGHVACIR